MQMSQKTILDTAYGALNRKFTLQHHTEGYEVAGSGTRPTKEKWSVTFPVGGATHGKEFKTEKEARDYFTTYTTPIEEQR